MYVNILITTIIRQMFIYSNYSYSIEKKVITMTLKLIDTYSEGDYTEYEVLQCQRCKRTFTILSGGDVCGCPCEFDNEKED